MKTIFQIAQNTKGRIKHWANQPTQWLYGRDKSLPRGHYTIFAWSGATPDVCMLRRYEAYTCVERCTVSADAVKRDFEAGHLRHIRNNDRINALLYPPCKHKARLKKLKAKAKSPEVMERKTRALQCHMGQREQHWRKKTYRAIRKAAKMKAYRLAQQQADAYTTLFPATDAVQ